MESLRHMRAFVRRINANFVLLGRQPERLVSVGNNLLARGAATAESVTSYFGEVAAIHFYGQRAESAVRRFR